MAELIELITNKNVKDTVSSSKETQKKKHKELFKLMELYKLDKTTQDFILKGMSIIK